MVVKLCQSQTLLSQPISVFLHVFFWFCRRATRDDAFVEHQDSSSAGHEYLLSLYWAAATMTSTGYGDITPDSTLSYLIAIVTEVGGLLVFGYILATTAATLTNNDAPK